MAEDQSANDTNETIVKLITSTVKRDRDRGVELLADAVDHQTEEIQGLVVGEVKKFVTEVLFTADAPWESKQGALMAASVILLHSPVAVPPSDFEVTLNKQGFVLLKDGEYRVRLGAGEVLGSLCKKNGPSVYSNLKETILNEIKSLLEDQRRQFEATSSPIKSPPITHKSRTEIFNDTATWKYLETWLKCLQCVADGCGPSFSPFIDIELLETIHDAMKYSTRFVRETCCSLLGTIIGTELSNDNKLILAFDESSIYKYGDLLCSLLSIGLADVCSQVRLPACVAARKFLLGLPDDNSRRQYLVKLLPGLCFNRYYTAEGVRHYSQDTWLMVTSGQGLQLVKENIDEVILFYLSQLKVESFEAKETACICITEMATKLDKEVVGKYAQRMLDDLQESVENIHWSVRDAGCVASGNIVAAFPDESRCSMERFNKQMFDRLEDNAPTVREAAAIALANTVKAYGKEYLPALIAKIKEGLDGIKRQSASPNQSMNPVALAATALLNNSVSSVPNVVTPDGSCILQQYQRPSEPWELTDGCICLMCEVGKLPIATDDIAKLLPNLSQASSYNNYNHYSFFLQSVCKQIPTLFKSLGKRYLKLYVDQFFDTIFYAASSDIIPVSTAAKECIGSLSQMLGPNILRARVESYNPRFVEYLSDLHTSDSRNVHNN